MSNCREEECFGVAGLWLWPLHVAGQQNPSVYNTVDSKISPCFLCGDGAKRWTRFSWKYPNGRSRDLLWAMSLTKELGHPASLRLC